MTDPELPGPRSAPDDASTPGTAPEPARTSATAARLFDIRRVIGGLFVLYGAVLTAVGTFDGPAAIAKAQGVRINLWTGLGMLALGAAFLLWLRLSPPEAPAEAPAGAPDESGDVGGSGAAGPFDDAGAVDSGTASKAD
ncbi:hypothetical protein [Kitasatospora sp. NPDC059571]|uniref:hypothetical protein n=1 Tax=Kitasatospora sp. NPDC059571 TaxID=3346871 RepID=UPI0036C39BF6